MQKKYSLRQYVFRNSYLLVIAAWLVTISFIIDHYITGNYSPTTVVKNIGNFIERQEDDFDELADDTALVNQLAANTYSEGQLSDIRDKRYFLFLYTRKDSGLLHLQFWSTQVVEPLGLMSIIPGKTGLVKLANGYYVWRTAAYTDKVLLGLIPVKWNYAITNDYLRNSFTIGDNIEDGYNISQQRGKNEIKSKENTFLFSLQGKTGFVNLHNNQLASLLRLLATFIILVFVHLAASFIVRRNFGLGLLFIVGVVVGLRVLSYYYPIPMNFRQYEMFDPNVYGSNAVMKTLGDLLINSLLFLWLILFLRFHVQVSDVRIRVKNQVLRWLILLVGIVLLIGSTFVCSHIFKSLVADSNISFDVVNFYTLTEYSVIGLVILSCISISYFLWTQLIFFVLKPLLPKNKLLFMLALTITGLLILSFRINSSDASFELYCLLWLVLFLILQNTRYLFLQASALVSSRLIFWLFFFSLSIDLIILGENQNRELTKRKNYSEALGTKADPASERLMNTVLTDFRSEALAPVFAQFRQPETNKQLKDSLLNVNFTGYLNKYDTRIFTFDERELPLYNEDSSTFNTLNTILTTQAKLTSVPDLYFYDVAYDRFNYISKKDITDSAGSMLGHIFILASPKRFKLDALYPELFLKGYDKSIENSPIYYYAVYNNLKLVNSHNDYAFPLEVTANQIPKSKFRLVRKTGYDELWYKAGFHKLVVIVKKDKFYIEAITLFSYLFCSFVFVTGLFWLLNAMIRSRLRWSELSKHWQMSIRNQVHSTIIFISLTAFIIVGVATILFFIERYNNNNRERLSRTINVMQNEVRNSLTELMVFDEVSKVYDAGYRVRLDRTITRISEVHAVDINLYDLQGSLRASSLPLPYKKGIVSSKMDPVAYYHLNRLKEIQFFKQETIGSLQFLSNYVPVVDELGREYAYLNIPYFTSQSKLRQEISNFLVAIINLNAFIFLIAGIVAFFITNRITRSFSFISTKMKAVNLGQMNEAIVWNRQDEIGELVKEYNKMVAKLDNSAAALAKSEREGAWREMARQVAHEIKNPLTPMKLSLQYLQRAIDSKSPGNVMELTRSVARTLVEQIDHLSQIAGEFSQFANIGNPRNEIFDLNESIKLLTQLHSLEDNLDLHWRPAIGPVLIDADRTNINRLFTNLIQNALQAIPAGRRAKISLEEYLSESTVLITVQDNGTGIPQEVSSKIFTPNFTTKTSGTGLGLAMCKGIVEESKGSIWFKTSPGEGTTFYVELPRVRP